MPAIRKNNPVKLETGFASNSDSPISTADASPAKIKSTSPPKSLSARAQSKPWTGSELRQLWQHVLKHGVPGGEAGWEGVVEGRNGAQCRSAWRYRVIPKIEAALEGQGQGKGEGV